MGEYNGTPGELIYEYTLAFTKVVEYGISADALFSGQMPPPPEGARFDVYFEGPIIGPKLKGTVPVLRSLSLLDSSLAVKNFCRQAKCASFRSADIHSDVRCDSEWN